VTTLLIDDDLNSLVALAGRGVVPIAHTDEPVAVVGCQFLCAALAGAANSKYLHGVPSLVVLPRESAYARPAAHDKPIAGITVASC